MPTDTERREVARRLREVQADVIPGAKTEVHPIAGRIIGVACGYDLPDFQGLLGRLADLIEPTDGFDLDTVQRVCFECMEGCDESEWTLYTTIHDAIARYKRGESGPTCDREALLDLAGELSSMRPYEVFDRRGGAEISRRIREALGVVA